MRVEQLYNLYVQAGTIHTVAPGDIPGSIAKRYNISEEQLYQANEHLRMRENPGNLQLGAKVIIPEPHQSELKKFEGLTIDQQITLAAQMQGLDVGLFHAMIQVESNKCQNNRSKAGARGCGQLMPYIIKLFNMSNPDDTAENLIVSALYFKYLLGKCRKFPKEIQEWMALMMYNWGEGNVGNWVKNDFDPKLLTPEAKNHPYKVFNVAGRPIPKQFKKLYIK